MLIYRSINKRKLICSKRFRPLAAVLLLLWPLTAQANTRLVLPSIIQAPQDVVTPLLAKIIARPQFPDRTSQYQAAVLYDQQQAELKAAQDACEAAGGTFSSSGCYIPPPPPPVVYTPPVMSYVNSYDWGQCTWYVANRRSVPSDWGNANNWYWAAQSAGWAVGHVPRSGSIAWTAAGYYGHVAYVITVSGNQVEVAEMNVYGVGVVDTRWTYISDWGGFIL